MNPIPTPMTPATTDSFPHNWTARILTQPPLIAPVRQFTYPQNVPGEEDALARGALLAEIKAASGGSFLATCALGFRELSLPSGIFACPRPDDILLVAGGYAYLVDTLAPERCLHLRLRPVSELYVAPGHSLLLLGGLNRIEAIGPTGLAWQSDRLSWEGITLDHIEGDTLHGTGWDMRNNVTLPYELDLRNGTHTGGGFIR